jgi:hypothetical protein
LKSTPIGGTCQKLITGRKFAEHIGLEDAEKIDNEPLILYFSKKNNTFVV